MYLNRYIKFNSILPGGLGHVMCDYLTSYILSKIFNLKFIHTSLIV